MLENFGNKREKMANLPKEIRKENSPWRDLLVFVDFRDRGCVEFDLKDSVYIKSKLFTFWNMKCKVFGNFSVKMFSKDSKIFYLIGKFISFLFF